MTPIEYLRLQAKYFLRDWQTRRLDESGVWLCSPKHINVDGLMLDYGFNDEEEPSLSRAQHMIAVVLGFPKWAALASASNARLKLAAQLWRHQNEIPMAEWLDYIDNVQRALAAQDAYLPDEAQLQLFERHLSNGPWPAITHGYLLQ